MIKWLLYRWLEFYFSQSEDDKFVIYILLPAFVAVVVLLLFHLIMLWILL